MNRGRPASMQQQDLSRQNIMQGSHRGGVPLEDSILSAVSGRSEWRQDEHGRFMQALELYGSRRTGDEWKHIAAFVGSRTIEEVRLHGRQYLQRLVQQLPPSPEVISARRYLSSTGSQNDPNRQNYQVHRAGVSRIHQPRAPVGGSRALSAAALECAQSMNVQVPVQFRNQTIQPLQQQHQVVHPRRNGRRSMTWTFQEEKAFETVLAAWAGNKPYSWAKIAAALPGKTAKDVRNRYDEMLGEVASIEAGEMSVPENPNSNSVPINPAVTRPPSSTSTLSQRAVPPPPIEVPPRSVSKDGAVGSFTSGSSTRSRRGSSGGITMLSPTFLDLLAKEAESEEKSPLPFPGLTNLPSPLFSPTLLPSGSPGFFSPGNKKSAGRGQQDKKFSSTEGSGDTRTEDIDTGPTASIGKTDDPRRSTTPRVWNEFLADNFKFDDPLGATPRKTPRSKSSTIFGKSSSTAKTSRNDAGKNADMTDASAA